MAPLPKFETSIPQVKHCLLSFPRPNVLLVKLNRAKDLNCINRKGHIELDSIWNWMDAEPNLACGSITGSGRAFSAGADLKGNQPQIQPTSKPIRMLKTNADGVFTRMESDKRIWRETQHARFRLRRSLAPQWSQARHRRREWHLLWRRLRGDHQL